LKSEVIKKPEDSQKKPSDLLQTPSHLHHLNLLSHPSKTPPKTTHSKQQPTVLVVITLIGERNTTQKRVKNEFRHIKFERDDVQLNKQHEALKQFSGTPMMTL
jgi:hypothetical protein